MQHLPPALVPLSAYNQFVLVQFVTHPNRTDKIPINLNTMKPCDAHDKANWLAVADALAYAETLGDDYGIGFVLTAGDPFFCIDIDHCLSYDDKQMHITIDERIVPILKMMKGCAVEISHSNKGLHIWGSSTTIPAHSTRNSELGMEFYTEKRFIALTGNMLGDVL